MVDDHSSRAFEQSLKRAHGAWERQDWRGVLAELEPEMVATPDPRTRVEACAIAARTHWMAWQIEDAIRLADRGLALTDSSEIHGDDDNAVQSRFWVQECLSVAVSGLRTTLQSSADRQLYLIDHVLGILVDVASTEEERSERRAAWSSESMLALLADRHYEAAERHFGALCSMTADAPEIVHVREMTSFCRSVSGSHNGGHGETIGHTVWNRAWRAAGGQQLFPRDVGLHGGFGELLRCWSLLARSEPIASTPVLPPAWALATALRFLQADWGASGIACHMPEPTDDLRIAVCHRVGERLGDVLLGAYYRPAMRRELTRIRTEEGWRCLLA